MGLGLNDRYGLLSKKDLPTTPKEIIMGKAYDTYTVSDIHRLDLSFMKKDRTPEEIADMSGNVSYLVQMAKITGNRDLLDRKFLELFDRDTFHTLNRGDMNKALHEVTQYVAQRDQALAQATEQNDVLNADIEANEFAMNTLPDLKSQLSNVQNDRNYRITNIEDYQRRINQEMAYLTEYNERIDNLHMEIDNYDPTQQNTRLINSIKAVIAQGYWQYLGNLTGVKIKKKWIKEGEQIPSYSRGGIEMPNGLYFKSTNDIVCRHYNPAAGVDSEVNFGKLLICVKPNGCISSARFIENFQSNGEITQHPHLSASSSICWGNAQTQYSDLVADTDPNILEILVLFQTLLEQYCPDNPYQSLESFKSVHGYARVSHAYDINCTAFPEWSIPEEVKAEIAAIAEKKARLQEYTDYYNEHRTDDFESGEFDGMIEKVKTFYDQVANIYLSNWDIHESSEEGWTRENMYVGCEDMLFTLDEVKRMFKIKLSSDYLYNKFSRDKFTAFVMHSANYHGVFDNALIKKRALNSVSYAVSRVLYGGDRVFTSAHVKVDNLLTNGTNTWYIRSLDLVELPQQENNNESTH